MTATTGKIEASLSSAMALAFAEIEGATKSANNPHFKSKYADLTAVIEAIKPALIKHGLFFTQRPQPSEGGVTVETFLHHASGQELSLGALFVPANKNDAQGFGSALTYARRYALVTAFGVPVEDDDGNAAAQGQRNSTVSPAQPISNAQMVHLQSLIQSTNTDVLAFCKHLGVKTLDVLAADRFGEARTALEAKLAKMVKDETDAQAKEEA